MDLLNNVFGDISPLAKSGLLMTFGFFVLWVVLYKLSHSVSGAFSKTYVKLDYNKQVEWNSRCVDNKSK